MININIKIVIEASRAEMLYFLNIANSIIKNCLPKLRKKIIKP